MAGSISAAVVMCAFPQGNAGDENSNMEYGIFGWIAVSVGK